MGNPPNVFTLDDLADIADLERWLSQHRWRVISSVAKAWPDMIRIEPATGPEPALVGGFYLQAGQSIEWDGREVVRHSAVLPPMVGLLIGEVSQAWNLDRALPMLTENDLQRLRDAGDGGGDGDTAHP